MRVRWGLWIISILLGTLIFLQAFTDNARWERHTRAGKLAVSVGNYAEAEKQFQAALVQAKSFGAGDPRFRESLNNLGMLYQTETKNAQSAPLYGRKAEPPARVL